jgi:hypothetical protein
MLGKLLRTLSWKVSEERSKWASQNELRLKYEPGIFGRLFANACELPLKWASTAFLVAVALCLMVGVWPPPYPGLFNWQPDIGEDGTKWSVVEPFVGLWAVQAALVAVVYPIVVAFVTVLLQRQNASKASLHAYFSRSAAKLTGLSSLALVLLMTLQFVVLDEVDPLVAFAWLIGDSFWAVVNVVLCIVFLHATFDFASPEGRAEARFEYILTQAWPSEWEHHVKRLVSFDPIKHGLIRADRAVGDLTGTEPAFSNPGDGLAKEHAAHFRFRRERSVADLSYVLVQAVYELWRWRAKGTRSWSAEELGWSRVGPVFQLSIPYGERFACNEPVALTSGGAPLGLLERFLLRVAFTISRRRVDPRVLVRDALEELKGDAALAIQADSETEFERQLLNLMEMIDAVVEASACMEDGKPDNWVLLTDSEHVARPQELIWTWLRIVRDLHGIALKSIVVRDVFAAATVRMSSRMVLRQSKSLTDKLRQIYVQHQFLLLYDLLGWGAEGCALGSFVDGNPGKLLDEPLRRRYDRVLREGLGAWESMKNYRLFPRKFEDQFSWENSSSEAETLGLHLRYNVQLVAHALRSDDRAGFEYFADSLMKWVGQRDFSQTESGVEYGDRYRVTVSDLSSSLTDFRARFPLPSHETEGHESIRAVQTLALKNLWRDVVFTLAASSLNQTNSGAISRGFASRVVRHLVDGLPILSDGDSLGNSRPFDTADRILSSLFRQLVEGVSQEERYKERIDKVAESVGLSAMARGISERIYSRSGSDIDYILDAQLLILARLAPVGWMPSSHFDKTMRSWSADDDLRRQMLYELNLWIKRLSEGDIATRYAWLWREAAPSDGAAIAEHLSRAQDGLNRLLERLGNLREQQIKEAKIAPEAKKRVADAAQRVIGAVPNSCPLSLIKHPIAMGPDVAGSRAASLRISGYDKGAMTKPLMAQLAANEDEWISDIVENALAYEVLNDVVYRIGVEEREASGCEAWLAELRSWAKRCHDVSITPLAVVPSRVDPPWLLDLIRDRVGETDEAAQVRRRTEYDVRHGYIGHLGDVALFTGPLRGGLTALMSVDEFANLQLEGADGQAFLVKATPDATELKCNLEIAWKHRLDGKRGPVARILHSLKESSSS